MNLSHFNLGPIYLMKCECDYFANKVQETSFILYIFILQGQNGNSVVEEWLKAGVKVYVWGQLCFQPCQSWIETRGWPALVMSSICWRKSLTSTGHLVIPLSSAIFKIENGGGWRSICSTVQWKEYILRMLILLSSSNALKPTNKKGLWPIFFYRKE